MAAMQHLSLLIRMEILSTLNSKFFSGVELMILTDAITQYCKGLIAVGGMVENHTKDVITTLEKILSMIENVLSDEHKTMFETMLSDLNKLLTTTRH